MPRLIDCILLIFAFGSILFATPDDLAGQIYTGLIIASGLWTLLSGPNWQLIPAYLILICRLLLSYYDFIYVPPLLVLLGKLLGMVALATSSVLIILAPIPTLPALWNRPVCTQEVEWQLHDSVSTQSQEISQSKKMRIKVWAPCVPESTGKKAPYFSRVGIASILKVGLSDNFPSLLSSHISLATTNSYLSDNISREKAKWPLLLFSHGLKGNPEVYTTYAEQLASLGFIVIAPTHTDGSCSESYVDVQDVWEDRNAQLNRRVRDMKSLLNALQNSLSDRNLIATSSTTPFDSILESFPKRQLDPVLAKVAARIDFSKVGICGHSFGGATAAQLVHEDSRVISGLSWDGWMFPLAKKMKRQNTKPFVYVNSDGFQWFSNVNHMKRWCANNTSGGHIITVKGTAHHNYNDLPIWSHSIVVKWISNNITGWFGDLDPQEATKIGITIAATFFDQIFQNDTTATPEQIAASIKQSLTEHNSRLEFEYIPPQEDYDSDDN